MGRNREKNPMAENPAETQGSDVDMETEVAEPKKEKRDKRKRRKRQDPKPRPKGETADVQPEDAPNKDASMVPPPSIVAEPSAAPPILKKRKRATPVGELAIDIDAPEPPSKKALRKLKKQKKSGGDAATTPIPTLPPANNAPKPESHPEHASQSRSKWGIWIGNLTFATSKPDLETFFTADPSPISRIEVTRINLPTNPQTRRNKGFAYVDFASRKALDYALSMSEKLWNGRRVLIKDARDFSSRGSTTPAPQVGADLDKNPPSNILFVGNLDFATTESDLMEHFAFAGKIAKVRLTKFEDTGKCKGFGFVDFENEAQVKRAMLGLSAGDEEKLKTAEGKVEERLAKLKMKRGIIGGRKIKMEYGEDSSVRYKKRFGKAREREEDGGGRKGAPPRLPPHLMDSRGKLATGGVVPGPAREEEPFEKKFADKRSVNPGTAYSNDVRRTGAITESRGKRVKFQ